MMKVRIPVKPKTTPLVSNLLYQDKVTAVQWGKCNEEKALKEFYASEATKHIDFKLEKSGLFLDKNTAYVGASPDGIMYCNCHGKAVIEIKCPFSIKNGKIADVYEKRDLEDNSIVLQKR